MEREQLTFQACDPSSGLGVDMTTMVCAKDGTLGMVVCSLSTLTEVSKKLTTVTANQK